MARVVLPAVTAAVAAMTLLPSPSGARPGTGTCIAERPGRLPRFPAEPLGAAAADTFGR